MNTVVDQVLQGDCLDIMDTFEPGSIDMVLCDLPYGTTRNPWDIPINLDRLWELYRKIVKPTGVIALMAQGRFTAQLIMSNPSLFRYKIVWIKSAATNFLNVQREPLRKHEDVCIFYSGTPVYHPQMRTDQPYDKGISRSKSDNYGHCTPSAIRNLSGRRHPTDVVFFEEEHTEDHVYIKSTSAEGKVYHATQKPVALGRYLVRTYSNESDTILDNTCGSGSFLVAAVLENRHYIGIEKNAGSGASRRHREDMIAVCRRRIAVAEQQKKLLRFPPAG